MARRPLPTYDAITLRSDGAQVSPEALAPAVTPHAPAGDRTQALKDVSAQLMLYLHPDAAKSLQRYALEQSAPGRKVKVHDLLIEAVEDWFRRHGLREPIRAKEPKKKKRLLPR